MRIIQLTLDGEEMPERITVDMSRHEALLIARLVGRTTGAVARDLIPCGDRFADDIYESLSSLFNRFYDGGIPEAVREA